MRCRDRLQDADSPADTLNPVLIPKNTELTRLIIRHHHDRNFTLVSHSQLAASTKDIGYHPSDNKLRLSYVFALNAAG